MNELDALEYCKLDNGKWEVTDEQGRKATGVTKEAAESQYRILYKVGQVQSTGNVDQYLKNVVIGKLYG